MIWGSSLYEIVILANSILVIIYPNTPCIHRGNAVDNEIIEEAEGGIRVDGTERTVQRLDGIRVDGMTEKVRSDAGRRPLDIVCLIKEKIDSVRSGGGPVVVGLGAARQSNVLTA